MLQPKLRLLAIQLSYRLFGTKTNLVRAQAHWRKTMQKSIRYSRLKLSLRSFRWYFHANALDP